MKEKERFGLTDGADGGELGETRNQTASGLDKDEIIKKKAKLTSERDVSS